MNNKKLIVFWFLLVTLSISLRFSSIYHGVGNHPDESDVVNKSMDLQWQNLKPPTYYYGSLVYYAPFFTKELVSCFGIRVQSFEERIICARYLGVVFGVIGIVFTGLLATQASGDRRIGCLAAYLLALSPLHIQLSHFYTSDVMVTTTGIIALWSCVSFVQNQKIIWLYLSVVFVAISFCFKVSGLTLGLPVLLSFLFVSYFEVKKWIYFIKNSLISCVLFLASVFVFQPYMFFEFARFKEELGGQIEMVKGLSRMPWNNQYQHTTPYLYQLNELANYLLGWPLFILMTTGLIICLFRNINKQNRASFVMAIWMLAVFISIGKYQVKFDRYLLPIMPVMLYFCVYTLLIKRKYLRQIFVYVIIICSTVPGVAFALIYQKPHSHEIASDWICRNIEAGKIILQIDWDTQLPKCSQMQNMPQYQMDPAIWQLNFYDQPSDEKVLDEIIKKLASADYVVFPSSRVFRGVLKVPDEYPLAAIALKALISEKLGYVLEKSFSVYPKLGWYELNDDLADESFNVHDHPKVMFFKNINKLNSEEIKKRVLDPNNKYLNFDDILLKQKK